MPSGREVGKDSVIFKGLDCREFVHASMITWATQNILSVLGRENKEGR